MPRTREQNIQIKLERYNDILNTSTYLFAFYGYGSVTIDDIAKKSHCSHGLFYHYFKDKEELFYSLIDHIVDDIEKWLAPIEIENQPAKYSFKDLISAILNRIKSNDDLFSCTLYLLLNLYFGKSTPKSTRDKSKKIPLKRQPLYSIVKFIIEKGKIEGSFMDEDSTEMTIAVLSLIKGLAYNRAMIGHKKFICPSDNIICHMVMR